MAAVIQNPLKALGDQFYKDAIEQCRSYNARLCAERSVRLPFLDSQTGVAQNNCYIWMERHHRSPGVGAGQMYTYPARCWRKKRRLHNATDPRLGIYGLQLDGGLMSKDSLPTQSTTLEALLRGEGLDKRNNSKNDEESLLEIQRVLEADAAEDAFNDDDDYEVDTPKRRHRGKGRGRGSGRRRADMDDDKPYVCDNRYKQKQNAKSSASDTEMQPEHLPSVAVCAKRYRNRTGLSYHYTHSHLAEDGRAGERSSVASKSPPAQQTDRHKRPKGPGGTSIPNNYCNKCQGAIKKTGKSGSPFSTCQCKTDRGEEKEDGTFTGAEELFGTTSESDTSTFHGFEDDELEEPATNSNGISNRHR
ncbi:zinc finger protein DPF3-like isoform X1 [Epinephelus moara]|uniref:zinc finger protein DPF3-like isoform X1 n=1 Tax=Epinephelus moara TaxID=300413 RepID=UPI00214E8658|nr:zinc finger protein DPF3-like isoform X1 [Epinephelus moara]XP_049917978.1 zinc finger protein DPF3-like isoform X1 [Epinephelus moara]